MEATQSDLIIIGAGPGGYEIAAREANAGHKVVLIEKNFLGGTCLNRGCIPTKSLLASAAVLSTIRAAGSFGINVEGVRADYAAVADRAAEVVTTLREGIRESLAKVELVEGEAEFVAPAVVAVGDKNFSAPKILIATGSAPARLDIPGAELAIDSDEFLKLRQMPRTAVVIGGGVIGLEFATVMAAFGVEVTVIEFCKEILPNFDKEIAKRLRSYMSRRGIKFITGAAVKSISEGFTVEYQGKKAVESVSAELVLMAVGRRPVVPKGLDKAGVELTPRGYIAVDARMQTTAPGIYAVGDVNGICLLAHAASAQAEVALGSDLDLNVIPSVVFTDPECASVGLTEDACKEKGIECRTAKSMFTANGKALASGLSEGLLKLVYAADDGRILGCSIVGAHAGDLIAEAAVAISAGLTVETLSHRLIHAHPTLSELYKI